MQHIVCGVLYTNCFYIPCSPAISSPPFYNMETEAQEDKVTKITQSVRDRLMARRHKLDFEVFQKESFFLEVVYSLVATESL